MPTSGEKLPGAGAFAARSATRRDTTAMSGRPSVLPVGLRRRRPPPRTVMSETMQTSAKVDTGESDHPHERLVGDEHHRSAASSDEPMALGSARSISSAPVTTERAACGSLVPTLRQRLGRRPARREARETVRDGPTSASGIARLSQASSAVNDEDGGEPERSRQRKICSTDGQRVAPPLRARRRIAVERVLAHIEVEGRQVRVHEQADSRATTRL